MPTRDPEPAADPLCDGDPLARALAKLRPVPPGLNPPQLLFLAGRAERDRSVAVWRRLSLAQLALLVLVGGASSVLLLNQPTAAPEERVVIVYRDAPQATTPAPEPPEAPPVGDEPPPYPTGFAADADGPSAEDRARWLAIRNDVLAAGLSLLPAPTRGWDHVPALPRGVFTVPPTADPKPPTPPTPDPE